MKTLIITAVLTASTLGLRAQETEHLSEERSSAWLTVTVPRATPPARTTTRPATTTRRTAPPPGRTPATSAQPKKEDAFRQTNQQVNRFKKKQ